MLPYLRFVCMFVDPTRCGHIACVWLHVVHILPTLHLRSSSDCLHVVQLDYRLSTEYFFIIYKLFTDHTRHMFCTLWVYLCILKDVCDVRYLYAEIPLRYNIVVASDAANAFFKQLLFITAPAILFAILSLGQINLNHILGGSHWCRVPMATVSCLVQWIESRARASLIMECKCLGCRKCVRMQYGLILWVRRISCA